jgi:LuxR family transcriptional regulator, maltose regulon positive regulatory protein
MPKPSQYALVWSHASQHYELHTQGQLIQCFREGEAATFSRWLDAHTSFAFVGQNGRLSMLKEARLRGSGYWYAYQKQGRQTRKRYLGRSNQVTFARLELVAHILTNRPELSSSAPEPGTPSSEVQGMLLSSKLTPPRLPHALVERTRLLADLAAMSSYPFTLVSAAAGSGKTTLLATWVAFQKAQANSGRVQGADQAVAWLSLEELDDDPIRFWDLVIAGLRHCRLTLGEAALALLHSPQSLPLSTVLTALFHDLERNTQDIILILDDYHVISDQAICDSMSFLLTHVPSTLHVVLVGRTDPDLPLARFRVRGQVLEIRDQDLRFTDVEAAHYLREAMGLPLSEDEIATLSRRTEGWIAGLHLAALSLRKRPDHAAFVKDFAGNHRYLLDYVQQDILTPLPESLQDFLLQTSLLTRMNAALCQAVTAAPDEPACQQILEKLERTNLFVVSLDEHRHWYRYHDLFREALLARLQARQPELVPLLHIRAAHWYQAAGELREAIVHSLAAPDYPLAASLMEQAVEQFWERGEAATMARWVLLLPEQQVREHAHLLLTTALYLLSASANTAQAQRARARTEAQQLMARVETTLRSQVNQTNQEISATGADTGAAFPSGDLEAHASEEALLQRHLRLLRMYLVLYEVPSSGGYERLSSMQQVIEEELEREEEAVWQMIPLACHFILHYAIRPEGANLVPQLLSAKEQVSRSGSHYATLKVRQWLAVAAVKAGQLRLASEESQAALALIEQMKGFALLKGYFEYAQAEVSYQWNRLEEARDLLRQVVHDAATWQHLDLIGAGYGRLLLVALATGDESLAELALHELEHLMERERFGFYPDLLPTLRAQWWLAQGQVREASDWAASIVFPQGAWDSNLYYAFSVVMRVYFAERSFREAASLLERWSGHLDRPTNMEITLTYLAQSLVALYQTGKSEQAREVAARLFALTEQEGYLRVYLDEGKPMRQALSALQASARPGKDEAPAEDAPTSAPVAIARPYLLRLLAAFEQEEQKKKNALHHSLAKTPHASSVPGRVASAAPTLVEPLTGREQEVLRLLAAGASNQQIAAALLIQLSTVKKHVSNLLAKLGAESRTQAIAQARALSLL